MDQAVLPTTGFLRIGHILGDPKAKPPLLPMIPVSVSKWYRGIEAGEYPRPIKHGKSSFWKIEDIKALIDRIGNEDGS